MNSDATSSRLQPEASKLAIREDCNGFYKYFYMFATSVEGSSLATGWQVVQSRLDSSPSTMLDCESAAIAYYEDRELEAHIDTILHIASVERFEDGMVGRTSDWLNRFVSQYAGAGMQQLSARLNSDSMNQAVAADIVRILGRIEHERSHNDRLYMAECLLYSELPLARDAGAVALSDLADERSVPALQRAIEAEAIPSLKADLQASLDELINDTHGIHLQEA